MSLCSISNEAAWECFFKLLLLKTKIKLNSCKIISLRVDSRKGDKVHNTVGADLVINRLSNFWVHMNVVPRSTGNTNSGTRELTLKCKFKCYINPWITHWALALVKGNREPHEAKKKSFDLGGNRTHDLRIRSSVTLPTELQGRTEKVGDDFRWWIAANRK